MLLAGKTGSYNETPGQPFMQGMSRESAQIRTS